MRAPTSSAPPANEEPNENASAAAEGDDILAEASGSTDRSAMADVALDFLGTMADAGLVDTPQYPAMTTSVLAVYREVPMPHDQVVVAAAVD